MIPYPCSVVDPQSPDHRDQLLNALSQLGTKVDHFSNALALLDGSADHLIGMQVALAVGILSAHQGLGETPMPLFPFQLNAHDLPPISLAFAVAWAQRSGVIVGLIERTPRSSSLA